RVRALWIPFGWALPDNRKETSNNPVLVPAALNILVFRLLKQSNLLDSCKPVQPSTKLRCPRDTRRDVIPCICNPHRREFPQADRARRSSSPSPNPDR